MALPLDMPIFQFNMWETLDEETLELTQTSEFWTQVQCEAERLDLVPPADLGPELDEDSDWRILEQEDRKDNIVHHDCMWAGSCADSVHPSNTFVPQEGEETTAGRSLLRRDWTRPETPPPLDGDAVVFRHTVDVAGTALRLLRDSAAVAADHSYTLARQHLDNLGVQTPSDSCESEEEIDVVSLGNSPQPATPIERAYSRTPMSSPRHSSSGRKRSVPPAVLTPPPTRRRRGARRGRRSNTDSDSEVESNDLERRSIHNDMERLRRIGLKNLFDELKNQVPATRDKERAPKVVILREAAALCRRLREEDAQREQLRRQQARLLARLKKLRTYCAQRAF